MIFTNYALIFFINLFFCFVFVFCFSLLHFHPNEPDGCCHGDEEIPEGKMYTIINHNSIKNNVDPNEYFNVYFDYYILLYHYNYLACIPALLWLNHRITGEMKLSHMGLFIRCCLLSSMWVQEKNTPAF